MSAQPDRAAGGQGESRDPSGQLGLVLFWSYLIFLALGTVGELFDIGWILKLPLWAP